MNDVAFKITLIGVDDAEPFRHEMTVHPALVPGHDSGFYRLDGMLICNVLKSRDDEMAQQAHDDDPDHPTESAAIFTVVAWIDVPLEPVFPHSGYFIIRAKELFDTYIVGHAWMEKA